MIILLIHFTNQQTCNRKEREDDFFKFIAVNWTPSICSIIRSSQVFMNENELNKKKAFKIKHSIELPLLCLEICYILFHQLVVVDRKWWLTTNEQLEHLKKLKAKAKQSEANKKWKRKSQKYNINNKAGSECQTEPTDTSECGMHLYTYSYLHIFTTELSTWIKKL